MPRSRAGPPPMASPCCGNCSGAGTVGQLDRRKSGSDSIYRYYPVQVVSIDRWFSKNWTWAFTRVPREVVQLCGLTIRDIARNPEAGT
jgi:hypothetical protein